MRNQRKRRKIIKRLMSGVSALALSVGLLASIPASADDSNVGYKYTLFAYSSEDGAISSSADNFCVNGNIATNGTISAGQNFNVNGEKKEHTNEAMPDLTKAITEKFFAENVDVKTENYAKNETNIEVKVPTDVKGKAELNGNIQLSAGLKAMGDIALSGNVLNKNSTVLFSENGNIVINTENANLTGLVYAPKGDIIIESKNLNLNSVVMIANKITLNAPNVNINSNAEMAKFVQEAIDKNNNNGSGGEEDPVTDPVIYAYGEYNEETKSVDIEWYSNVTGEFAVLESMNGTDYTVVSKVPDDTKYSIKVTSDFIKKYFKVTTIKDGKTIESIPFAITKATGKYTTELLDTDKDGLADLYEEMLGTDKTLPDTDKDGLTDYEEAYITNTDPTKYDSVTEGVSDADADNDKDGLTNKKEIKLKTGPNSDDTDGDNLKDGDEVSKYNTDPTKRDTDGDELEDDDELKFKYDPNKKDTDGNGIIDSKEKNKQTIDVVPDNKEQAVTKVSVSMAATGNIEKTTTVESIMNKDVLCSNVVGLVGEPFSIESESSFDKATITFTVDKTKLGETEFDNLMFLWYDRENDNFVELETSHDAANSTVSVETTHFSEYMIVDSKMWFDNWRTIAANAKTYTGVEPGSGSSQGHSSKAIATVVYIKCTDSNDPDFKNPDPYSTTIYTYTNYRKLIGEHLISTMSDTDVMRIASTKENNQGGSYYFTMDAPSIDDVVGWEESIAEPGVTGNKKVLKQRLSLVLTDTPRTNIIKDIIWASDELLRKSQSDKRIVYVTDHSEPVNYSALVSNNPELEEKYKKAYGSVPVYFVCIGNFDRSNLEKIADETGGKVYTVATSSDIYKFYSDADSHFDPYLVDSDDDGLTDYEEMAGFYTSNCGKIYTDPQNPDTDGDGLKDGDEFFKKFIKVEASTTAGKDIYKCYSVLLSDPTKKDTDDDGYYDTCDPDRNNKPVFIGDKYDFMDNEIYYLKGIYDKYLDVQNSSSASGSNVIMYNKNGDDNQKFRFVWAGTGYSIHPLNNEKLALTLHKKGNEHSVSLEAYTNSGNQRWEILPYTNNIPTWIEQGIVIRSQVLSDPDEDGKQKSLYLSYGEEDVIVSTRLDLNCIITPENIADWERFGFIYMKTIGWLYGAVPATARAVYNYCSNRKCEFGGDNIPVDDQYSNCLVCQYKGAFTEMKFADSQMSEVCCEIMAAYNAMCIANDNSKEVDFCKLASEFEINALLMGKTSGSWGSDPLKIDECLKAYNYEYQKIYDTELGGGILMLDEFQKEYIYGKSAIVAYTFKIFKIHTFALRYSKEDNELVTYNLQTGDNKTTAYKTINDAIGDNRFGLGYVIYNKRGITI